ncbi:hypothetical protein Taro_012228 [Colocasia esculenta]|uniref:Uncharacterized protein n=1 Tax=Colocasia esculenta TaxID=4460 RepID=A0A843UCC6_COLES|nr:hypothetical protein [Colocasia esculenta]
MAESRSWEAGLSSGRGAETAATLHAPGHGRVACGLVGWVWWRGGVRLVGPPQRRRHAADVGYLCKGGAPRVVLPWFLNEASCLLFMVVWQASTWFRWSTKFKLSNGAVKQPEHTADRRRYCLSIYSAVAITCMLFFIGCAFVATDYKVDQGKPLGSKSLPRGIVSQTSNLEMQSLFGFQENKRSADTSKNLLAMAVGIKQKEIVDQIVRKVQFISSDFIVMLFHYDGIVAEWAHFQWCDSVLHVSAINQTKWWFAKRFLHPDIVAEYSYIFLWDEDLGLEHFDPKRTGHVICNANLIIRYVKIIEEEGLEISQPALDSTDRSKVHHQITVRQRRNKVHRRFYKLTGGGRCYGNSTGPPCTGFVEMMAPVFSRAAWRCAWYMIQVHRTRNDLIYAWGLDFKLGYCAQGERTKKVGVVDAEYIDHMAIPSLGGLDLPKVSSASSSQKDDRLNVRMRSYAELHIFQERWKKAVEEDGCWIDPYSEKIK